MGTEEKDGMAKQAYAKAFRYELDYGCCPQCVLTTVQELVGGIDDATIKAVHGLSGGGGLMARTPTNTRRSARRAATSAPMPLAR